MKFVALFTGFGEGCGSTINCNVDFKVFDAKNCDLAIEVCKKYWADHGKSRSDPPVVDIDLYQLAGDKAIDKIPVGIDVWNKLDQDNYREGLRKGERDLDTNRRQREDRPENVQDSQWRRWFLRVPRPVC